MADKVIVTKNKLDDLADSISTKAGVATPMTLSEMKTAVDNIQTGGGGSGGTDTSDATLTSGSQMLSGVTAYSKGTKYTGTIATKTGLDVTVSGGAVTTPTGYYATAVTKSVGTGHATAPASITDTNPTLTTSGNTLTFNKTVSVTPVVTAGYITEGTATDVDVSLTKSMPVVGAQLFTPGTSTRTVIPSMTYCSGPQSIEGDANLVPENIISGKSIFGIAGTASTGKDTLVERLHNRVTHVEDDTLTTIPSYGLASISALTSVSFPNLQTIDSYGFYNDTNLVMSEWIFPKIKTIGAYAFRYDYAIKGNIVLPTTCTSIGVDSFASCTGIETFRADGAITSLGSYTFTGESHHIMALREVHMPNLGANATLSYNFGNTSADKACQHLEICDIGNARSIAANAFANCYALQTLIMRRASVTTLSFISAFDKTPLKGYNNLTAKIYVPEALIDKYKAASNWKTIDGYGFVEWCAIEGSDYEL